MSQGILGQGTPDIDEFDALMRKIDALLLELSDPVKAAEDRALYVQIEQALIRADHDRMVAAALAQQVLANPSPIKSEPDTAGNAGVTADTLLSVAWAAEIDARCAALTDGRYSEHIKTATASFIALIGDKPIRQYAHADLQQFATKLSRVPTNRSKRSGLRDLGIVEAIEANARRQTPFSCLSARTINAYLAEVATTWRRATADVAGVQNITAASVTTPRAAAASVIREPLPPAALSAWLADAAHQTDPRLKWVPILGLLTGMRLGEIVFCQPSDIISLDGRPVVDLRRPLTIRGVQQARPLKTASSARIVVLHDILVQSGFVAWAQKQPGDWIFSAWHRNADPADAAQKRLNRLMQDLGIHRPRTQVFHSLRHNTKSWLRPIVGERTADLQCGHTPASVGGKYGHRILTIAEIDQVRSAPLPTGVDFGPFLPDR